MYDPWLRGSLHKRVATPCKGVATEKMTWENSKSLEIAQSFGEIFSHRPWIVDSSS